VGVAFQFFEVQLARQSSAIVHDVERSIEGLTTLMFAFSSSPILRKMRIC
jgi:hypothetical protein